jgi:hypothetical protein
MEVAAGLLGKLLTSSQRASYLNRAYAQNDGRLFGQVKLNSRGALHCTMAARLRSSGPLKNSFSQGGTL